MTGDYDTNKAGSYEITFSAQDSAGNKAESSMTLHVIDPAFKFPRRRSSVRTPPLDDMHEKLPIIDIPTALPPTAEKSGTVAFWRAMYATIRTAEPFPVALDDVVEAIRYLQLVKKASPFAK